MGITPKNPAHFDPAMGDYKELTPFRYWCQKILPLVYDDSLSYYELLCKVVDYLNKSMEDIDTLHGDVDNLNTAFLQLQNYVNDYFSTLDVQTEINNKLDEMAEDGTLDALILPYFNEYKEEIDAVVTTQNRTIATQNEAITVLQARMDTFTNLPQGSTTGDAELTDIRVGGNGITYPTAGDAVRAQYTTLANGTVLLAAPEAGEYSDDMYYGVAIPNGGIKKISTATPQRFMSNLLSLNYTGGANLADMSKFVSGYLNSAGTITPSDAWSTSDFIEVKEYHYYYIFRDNSAMTFWYRCFYDETKTLIQYSNVSAGFVQAPPNAKFARFSYQINQAQTVYITEDCYDTQNTQIRSKDYYLAENANDKLKAIKKKTGVNMLNPERLIQGSYLEQGHSVYNNTWYTTDYIPVEVGETYSITRYNIATDVSESGQFNLCFGYYEDLTPTATRLANYESSVVIPENVKYIRFCSQLDPEVWALQMTHTNSWVPYTPFMEEYYFNDDSNTALKWEGVKWTCVGDSLTEVNNRTTKHYFDYISKDTGTVVTNMGVSGTGYARGGNNFYNRILEVPLDSEVITIFGGGNDLGAGLPIGDPSDGGDDPTTLCGYVNGTIDRLLDRFPLANVGIVTPTPWVNYTPEDPDNMMQLYSNAIVEICKRRSIPCLNLYNCSGLHPDMASFRALAYSKDEGNGVHPDETGHKIIAPRFEAFLDELLMH